MILTLHLLKDVRLLRLIRDAIQILIPWNNVRLFGRVGLGKVEELKLSNIKHEQVLEHS